MSIIGLLGSHRTGKTTLAKAYAQKHDLAFVETSVSAIFKSLGLDPAAKFTFSERLDIQEEVLRVVDKSYDKINSLYGAIADRTPLDMLAYTMSEAIGDSVSEKDQARFEAYARKCFEVTNRRFSCVILVQPGIPVVHEEGKASLNAAYMEHLNSLMLGLSVDERVEIPHFYIPRSRLTIEDRMVSLESAMQVTDRAAIQDCERLLKAGGFMQ